MVVVIPAAIGTPHPTFSGAIPGRNFIGYEGSKPSFPQSVPGTVALCTTYSAELKIKVVDQFGNLLDSVYDGAEVTEGKAKINQYISGGTYTDPVGVTLAYEQNVPTSDPRVTTWVTDPKVPLRAVTFPPDDTPVEIAGHVLNPAIVNRQVSTTINPDTLTITWP